MTTLDESVRAEIKTLRANGELDCLDGVSGIGRRCHVCCEAESLELVNKMLAAGLTNREITDACRFINDRREAKGDKRLIAIHNVREHRNVHFNIQKPALAAYRAIAERRAAERAMDVEEGVGTMVTPYAVLETVMVKGFGTITDEDTEVTVREAVDAAAKLQIFTSQDQSQQKMADLLYQMDRLISAAQNFIPPDLHGEFLAAVQGTPMSRGTVVEALPMAEVREFTPSTVVAEDEDF